MKVEIYKSPRIALIGHMGTGSIFGITNKDNIKNKYQKWLISTWNKCRKLCGIPNEYPTDIIFGGEILEGYNETYKGEDIWLIRLDDQKDLAVSLMMEWIGPETENIYLLYSHSYHGSRSKESRVEDDISRRLKLRLLEDKNLSPKIHVGTQFEIKYYDKIFRYSHGTQGGAYRASAMERYIKENLIRGALGDTPIVDYHFQFHAHRLAGAKLGNKEGYWCPCFKFLDTQGKFLNPDTWFPDIGMTYITFQSRFGLDKPNIDFLTFKSKFRFQDLEKSMDEWKKRSRITKKEGKIYVDTLQSSFPKKEDLGILEPK